jgi:NhaP-type Na+/H+ or K+/H+ antiporter
MMTIGGLAVVAVFVLAYSLVSRRLESTPITGPMVFVFAGIMFGSESLGLMSGEMAQGGVRLLAEATLVLLLFTDAIRIDLAVLRRNVKLPARLLGVGLPLTIITGGLLATLVFPDFGFWEAALLAAILSPTDAALGRAVVTNKRVPGRIRQALNVESGLNDGIMLPIITVFLALAAAAGQVEIPDSWTAFAAAQIGFGILVGGGVGYVGGKLIDAFAARGWVDGAFRQLGTLAVGVAAFGLAEIDMIGGNGFVAAFAAGLAYGAAARDHCDGAYDFAEDEGELLALLTFLIFGAAIAGPALGRIDWRIVLYVLISIFVARPLPAALSLVGARLKLPTVGFMAWFGPRGLASILFGLFILEEADLPHGDEILLVVTWTVLASVFLHGVTAERMARVYADWFSVHGRKNMEEAVEVDEMPTR